jgi:hypothetical protein
LNPCFRSRYFHDSDARTAFKSFVFAIHGLNLSLWDDEGYRDGHYIPF